ncbi:MAG: hypothetical protein IIW85_05825, partial [Bacteroidaceae bacterium]|nr:hypothetical protein [Bacteroidaceae bacterium]
VVPRSIPIIFPIVVLFYCCLYSFLGDAGVSGSPLRFHISKVRAKLSQTHKKSRTDKLSVLSFQVAPLLAAHFQSSGKPAGRVSTF